MALRLALMEIDFHLAACRSLKDKRRRMKKIGDRYAGSANIAVCESEFHDQHDRARWSFVGVAASARVVEQILTEAERWVAQSVDATIVGVHNEHLR